MQEAVFRKKVTWFNLICCITVIYSHAINVDLFYPEKNAPLWLSFLESDLMPWLIRFNVPCFIMISGYLFFRNFDRNELPRKWKRRWESLVIPYLSWNVLYYLGYLIGSQFPDIAAVLNREPMTFRLSYLIRAALFYTHNVVFWFLFQVILLVALTPVLYRILKRKWTAAAFFLGLLVLAHHRKSLPFLNLDALFYYSAAAFTALHLRKQAEGSWSQERALVGVILLEAGYGLSWLYYQSYWIPGILLFHTLTIPAMWLIIPENYLPEPKGWMQGTFFIYALHFIPTRLINKLAALQLPKCLPAAVGTYLLMPVIIILLCTLIAVFLKRYLPFLWRILSGNR